ncbi:epidermal growth factor receptor kinase substrate 8-like protein 3 [Engraulis encrasicolus]|uniref:epidermal growth factor receptor kinase substrate 8-like protein 3 n=1 Tax=Engraulis encrasicolus TaxID=184585 RepID=UPI002FD58260
MFQNGDAYYETSSYAGSVLSNGFSETSSLMSSMSRPSGRSIYMQRKEYVENINKQMGRFQYKVEHLFTCDVEGPDMRLDDCVERLKMLEAMGSIWGQDMILQARNGCLQLIDIETNEELESHPTGSVLGVEAMLDTCVYNSLLTVAVREEGKATVSVFMFQSDSLRADYIKRDLDRALMHRIDDRGDLRPPRDNMRAILAAKMGASQPNRPPSEEWDRPQPSPMEWDAPDYDESPVPSPAPPPQARQQPVPMPRQPEPEPRQLTPPPPPSPERTPTPQPYTEKDRNVDILNHIISDIEAFMGRVSAVAAKKSKKKLWKGKKKKNKPKVIEGMPSAAEFEICLQKIKFGFNLLAVLDGQIDEPSSKDLVHVFFSILTYLVEYCPEELPPAIVAPLFTPHCIRLLSEEATVEEDQFWQTLGDAWNIPSTQWGDDDEDIPEYNPLFDDGWEPRDADPEIQPPRQPRKSPVSKPPPQPASKPVTQPASKPASKPPNQPINRQPSQHSRKEAPAPQSTWKPPAEEDVEDDPASFMRVIFDFTARNPRELSISKGEVVQLLDMSKQWWKVRNNDGEEGFVPNNVLEPLDKKEEEHQQVVANPNLTRKSKPAEVRAWLEFKGFNKITVKCLGMLSGASLLGMTREELKMICPDEGGRVFFQLQNVKSANALASEVRHLE